MRNSRHVACGEHGAASRLKLCALNIELQLQIAALSALMRECRPHSNLQLIALGGMHCARQGVTACTLGNVQMYRCSSVCMCIVLVVIMHLLGSLRFPGAGVYAAAVWGGHTASVASMVLPAIGAKW